MPVGIDLLEIFLRLLAATAAGMAIGLNRDLKDKPTGMRTLGLVSLGAALVSIVTVHQPGILDNADAYSRVLQGILQGVLTGIGFIGAGAILRDPKALDVSGLTTASCVWVTAALGVACALAAWHLVWMGILLALAVLIFGRPIERLFVRFLARSED